MELRRGLIYNWSSDGMKTYGLLLTLSEGWSSSNDTIVDISIVLDLTLTLTSTIRAAVEVGIDFLDAIELGCQMLSNLCHFTESLVGEL
jgi:hypothetical protein